MNLERPMWRRGAFLSLGASATLAGLRQALPTIVFAQSAETPPPLSNPWELSDDEITKIVNDGTIWTNTYWAPTFPDYAAERGLPTLFQEKTGPVFIHDMVLHDHEFAGVEGWARHRVFEQAIQSMKEFPNSRTWNGGCRELAVAGLLCKEPLAETEVVAGFEITRSVRTGLLIALFKGYPYLAAVEGIPEITRQRVQHFLRYGTRFVVSYHSSDGGLWFGALKDVEDDGEHIVVTYPIEGERRLHVDKVWGTQYVRDLRSIGRYTEDLAAWEDHFRVTGLDPRMVFRLAYGMLYKTGS